MSDVTVLDQGGILQAADVASIAAAADLDLAAATLLIKESGGGRNVWGHDDVVVAPNTYAKGGLVTESSYTAYIAAVKAGRAGRQGCGPTQLTSGPSADEIAAAVWNHTIRNGFGDTVQTQQIIVADEKRAADTQQALAALAEQVARLQSALSSRDENGDRS